MYDRRFNLFLFDGKLRENIMGSRGKLTLNCALADSIPSANKSGGNGCEIAYSVGVTFIIGRGLCEDQLDSNKDTILDSPSSDSQIKPQSSGKVLVLFQNLSLYAQPHFSLGSVTNSNLFLGRRFQWSQG